jgi:CheY-like chemotaxis protein
MDKGLRILLVEDDDLLMLSFSDMLRDLGHDVIEATGALAALDELRGNPDINIMITDINLPEMDGCELVKQARVFKPNLPVIYSSGYGEDRVADLGIDPLLRFLVKPFGSEEAEKALRSFQLGLAA